jgi:CheY-like chemotaxis protein
VIIGNKQNQGELMAFVPSIKNNTAEWQLVTAKIPDKGKLHLNMMMEKLLSLYQDKEGILFPVKDYKIVMLIRLGIINNYSILKSEIENKIPEHGCRVIARKMNLAGLKQIQIDLSERENSADQNSLYEERSHRHDNVILIADDDQFIRKTLSKTLEQYAQVQEVGNGNDVVQAYLEHNPDVLLLDIHMPGKEGLEVIDEVMEIDTDAFIIFFSSDSVRENVLEALSSGAVGFLAKPVKKDKLVDYLKQCITFR